MEKISKPRLGLDAEKIQHREKVLGFLLLLIFTASLFAVFGGIPPTAKFFGLPIMSVFLSLCFCGYGGCTVFGYFYIFRHWRSK